jgi:hypothetical protein
MVTFSQLILNLQSEVNMFELKIECPKCAHSFKMDQALRDKVEAVATQRLEEEAEKLAAERKSIADREKMLISKESALGEEVKKKVEAEVEKRAMEIKSAALVESEQRMTTLQGELDKARTQVRISERFEQELRERVVEIEERERKVDLEIARRLADEKATAVDRISKQFSADYLQKDLEREAQLADMRNQIVILKRKAEQGSMQIQGEVLELQIEEMLTTTFPTDQIQPIEKGVRGADVLQTIVNHFGNRCGSILWETKRTKNFQPAWIEKLKEDRNNQKADLAVLVTEAFPKDCSLITLIDGVWIVSPEAAQGLAMALRHGAIEVGRVTSSIVSRTEKSEVLFRYLTSPAFRQRLEAIVEKFSAMRDDLIREKRLMTKSWTAREKHLENVIAITMEIYVDIQTVVGRQSLSIPLLEVANFEIEEQVLE